jgi:hypothetical protein
MRMRSAALCTLSLVALAAIARAEEPVCRSVTTIFKPVPRVQMAVWVEDETGAYVDTLYVTRLTGTLGLANRPGYSGSKSDFRYPYGARPMVMPVWAHARNHVYGEVVMGGAQVDQFGHRIGDTTTCGADCRNDTIGYHFNVSSAEPFYCGPSGGTGGTGLDATSCASSFYGSKGAYEPGGVSYYPPRADLTMFQNEHDSIAATQFKTVNDLGAVSGATPPGNVVIDPAVRWTPPKDGHYVIKVEVSKEFDFNAFHDHAPTPDGSPELQSYGLEDPGITHYGQPAFRYGLGGFGQPSIVYAVPITVGDMTEVATTATYVGYGDWDGATGTMHLPDTTITDGVDGTGVGRLLLASDQSGSWRVKVMSSPSCGTQPMDGGTTCAAPAPPTNLQLVAHDTSVDVTFASSSTGPATTRFDVRYREGMEITEGDFLSAIPTSTPPPTPGTPGSTVTMTITGLRPEQTYHVAVRALSSCDAASGLTTTSAITTRQKFATLSGCFIATAAYGSPLADELGPLRALRDRHLLTNPLGRVFVGVYYAMSPRVAHVISRDERMRSAARRLVAPIVELGRAVDRVDRLLR